MNISAFSSGKNVFVNCEYIKGYNPSQTGNAFKTVLLWDNYALLAKVNHMLSAKFAVKRIAMSFYNNIRDCFECLSPHENMA